MKCPVCKDVTLLMSEKKEIEIDYCPECRGIWLDRGELEKLIKKEEIYNKEHYESRRESKEDRDDKYDDKYSERKQYYDDDYDEKYYKNNKYSKKRRKESFMEEIFDIFGGD